MKQEGVIAERLGAFRGIGALHDTNSACAWLDAGLLSMRHVASMRGGPALVTREHVGGGWLVRSYICPMLHGNAHSVPVHVACPCRGVCLALLVNLPAHAVCPCRMSVPCGTLSIPCRVLGHHAVQPSHVSVLCCHRPSSRQLAGLRSAYTGLVPGQMDARVVPPHAFHVPLALCALEWLAHATHERGRLQLTACKRTRLC